MSVASDALNIAVVSAGRKEQDAVSKPLNNAKK